MNCSYCIGDDERDIVAAQKVLQKIFMIISRTPLRISFVGGGSDIQSFYKHHKGAVVSTAINKYIYIAVNGQFDGRIIIQYSKTEIVKRIKDIENNLVREALKMVGIKNGIHITSVADIPSEGSGMGSSSSYLAEKMRKDLFANHIDSFGEALHKNWLLKKSMAESISTKQIDTWYEKARKVGAIGGKLLGAGGGGFFLFYADQKYHKKIIKNLSDLHYVPFSFEPQGSKIIFIDTGIDL